MMDRETGSRIGLIVGCAAAVAIIVAVGFAASLRGSPDSMRAQHGVAAEHGLEFYQTTEDIREAVRRGELVRLPGDENYEVADFVSHPYAQPEAFLFVERLAAQYRAACGEKLVVTSATRAIADQPVNAHRLSVHPAGMAIDFRVSMNAECREFMEAAILGLETRGVINGIREYHPPHYHVAIYPMQYARYAAVRIAEEDEERERLERLAEARERQVIEEQRSRPLLGTHPLWVYNIPPVTIVMGAYRAAAGALG